MVAGLEREEDEKPSHDVTSLMIEVEEAGQSTFNENRAPVTACRIIFRSDGKEKNMEQR